MRDVRIFFRYPQLLFIIVAGVSLFAGLVNFHSSIAVKDYIETEGEICNVESKQVLWHQHYVTRYDYDIVWYDNSEKHTRHLEEQVDPEEEGVRTIWVRPDNKNAILSNSVDFGQDVPLYLLVGLVSGAIGFFICKVRSNKRRETRAQRIERLEDTKMYSIMVIILTVIAMGMFGIMGYEDYKNGYIPSGVWDTYFALIVIIVAAFVMYRRAKKQLR